MAATPVPEVRVICPSIVCDAGLAELVAEYNERPGHRVVIVKSARARIAAVLRDETPVPDVVGLPVVMMTPLARDGTVVADSARPFAVGVLGLAVRKGTPRPDISDAGKLAHVLKGASGVVVNAPDGGTLQGAMTKALLDRSAFSGIRTMVPGKGDALELLKRGAGEMAIQLVQDILADPEVDLVAPFPEPLGGRLELALAVSARSGQVGAARDLVRFLTGRRAMAVWKARGLKPI